MDSYVLVPIGPKLVPLKMKVDPPAVSKLFASVTPVKVGFSYFKLNALLAPPTVMECCPMPSLKIIVPEGAPEDVVHVISVLGVVIEHVEAKSIPLGP